ncbi:MAG: hypothetical protein ACRDYD_02665 [Acidimicrobiales bacterium]
MRRAACAAVAILLVLVGISVGTTLAAPGTTPDGVRIVEWVRGHGGSSLVAWAENVWYSHHKPPVGGRPAPGLIPRAGHGARAQAGAASARGGASAGAPALPAHLPSPPPIPQLAGVSVAGEGAWQPIGPTAGGLPTMEAAYVAPDAVHTSLVTAVVWMDTKLVSGRLFAGSQVPGTGTWASTSPLTGPSEANLVAAFNSGFRMQESQGGWYSEGHAAVPLRPGAASLVIRTDGTVGVGQWGRDFTMGPGIASVRQNLSLIVDGGHPVPGLTDNGFQRWGATLGNRVMVWRSGVGETPDGALVYAGGPGLSISSLADVLVRAGSVRAMELDINTEWVNFFSFVPPPGGAAKPAVGKKLLADMMQPVDRYFHADARDFVAIYLRPGAVSARKAGVPARAQAAPGTAG